MSVVPNIANGKLCNKNKAIKLSDDLKKAAIGKRAAKTNNGMATTFFKIVILIPSPKSFDIFSVLTF